MFNSAKTIAEQQTRITALEAELATANTERDAAQAKITELEARLAEAGTAHEAAMAKLKEEHTAALAAKDTEVDAKVNQGVIDAMAAIGVPQEKLPGRAPSGESGAASSYAEAIEHYNTLTDPKEAAAYWGSTVAKFIGKN